MQLNLENRRTETNYWIKLPNNFVVDCPISYKLIAITIGGTLFPGNFIQFNLSNFDIILGMNWLHTCGAKIDCEELKVILKAEKGREVCFYGQREEKSCPLISIIQASELLRQGHMGYWCYTIDTQAKEEKARNIHVVCEFEDVFPKELLGLPPHREIDFAIELIPDA